MIILFQHDHMAIALQTNIRKRHVVVRHTSLSQERTGAMIVRRVVGGFGDEDQYRYTGEACEFPRGFLLQEAAHEFRVFRLFRQRWLKFTSRVDWWVEGQRLARDTVRPR